MKERPILFSGAMVRALLEGRKTQTRRIFKDTAEDYDDDGHPIVRFIRGGKETLERAKCPYGKPGDRLWVRETFFASLSNVGADSVADRPVAYKATPSVPLPSRWIPSIHMPRWACRLVLEITDVRIERLHDITSEDAKAEGVPENMTYVPVPCPASATREQMLEWAHSPPIMQEWRQGFFRLWETINGKKSLDANPWVWAVTFKIIDPLETKEKMLTA